MDLGYRQPSDRVLAYKINCDRAYTNLIFLNIPRFAGMKSRVPLGTQRSPFKTDLFPESSLQEPPRDDLTSSNHFQFKNMY